MNPQNGVADHIHANGFHIIDHFLNESDFRSLQTTLGSLHDNGGLKKAKIGDNKHAQQNTSIRTDEICWLNPLTDDPSICAFFSAIEYISNTLNRTLYLGLMDFEAHFAVYTPGTFYKKHIDQFKTTQDRRISCVYYLNDDWQKEYGGELALYNKKDTLIKKINPKANRFVCFNSDLPHEVHVTHHTRMSIAGWLKTRSVSQQLI